MPVSNRLKRDAVLMAPNWPQLIDELSGVMPMKHVARVMGLTHLTEGMLRHYRDGVQPLYWRGEALVQFWCETFGKQRQDVPQAQVVRGHRIARRSADTSPKVINLPNWPVNTQPQAGLIARKKRGTVAA